MYRAINKIAKEAGEIILPYFNNLSKIEYKADESPVTEADKAAGQYISQQLAKISDLPIINEEIEHSQLHNLSDFWLVDPIDGTKSFISAKPDFSVNIALIKNGEPVLGVIYAPIYGDIYYVGEGGHAYKNEQKLPAIEPNKPIIAVASLSHLSVETKEYLDNLGIVNRVSIASSLKFCLLAEGKADIYPRFSPTMEWDIAAGHAILKAVGGDVTKIDGSKIIYGNVEKTHRDFESPFFIARGYIA